jgi:uncharacterized membrane protein YdjX (TVP38/TMEM64 family)
VAIVMVANGLAFGVWRGTLVSVAGGVVGASAAYAIGRWVGRSLLDRVVPTSDLLWADRLMAKYGAWAIVIGRWIPAVPLDPVSYVAGITRLPVLSFLALTIVGLLPADVATAYLGSQVGTDVPLQYWILGMLLVATIAVGWRAVREGRKRRGYRGRIG